MYQNRGFFQRGPLNVSFFILFVSTGCRSQAVAILKIVVDQSFTGMHECPVALEGRGLKRHFQSKRIGSVRNIGMPKQIETPAIVFKKALVVENNIDNPGSGSGGYSYIILGIN